MKTAGAWFECFEGCDDSARWGLDEIRYTCERCGSLLDVVHDRERLARRSGAGWRELFEARAAHRRGPLSSGVWARHEWVLPDVGLGEVVSLDEGWSHLFDAQRLGEPIGLPGLHIKLCGDTHTGSFKDLGMTALVSQVHHMRLRGIDVPAVGCASTGDTSAAVAAYSAAAGIPSVVFLPRAKISMAQLVQPLANGSLVLALDTDFDGCMALIQEVVAERPVYLANSMNPLRLEGQKTVALEIVQQLGWRVPDWVIVPGGNLGNVYALYKGFQMMRDLGVTDRLPRLVCAQAEQANPLYLAYREGWEHYAPVQAGATLASAIRIGNPVSIHRAIRALEASHGVVAQASEEALMEASARADRVGLFTCPHTGVALAALFALREEGTIAAGQEVVVVSTAHGLKFAGSKARYHEGRLEGVQSAAANPPLDVDASRDAVLDVLDRRLGA